MRGPQPAAAFFLPSPPRRIGDQHMNPERHQRWPFLWWQVVRKSWNYQRPKSNSWKNYERLMMVHKYEESQFFHSFFKHRSEEIFLSIFAFNQQKCPLHFPKILGSFKQPKKKTVCQNPNGEAKVTHLASPRHFRRLLLELGASISCKAPGPSDSFFG